MILAPPLLPHPFEVIAIRILRNPFPKSVPRCGFACKDIPKVCKSLFIEEYRLASCFRSFKKFGIGLTL